MRRRWRRTSDCLARGEHRGLETPELAIAYLTPPGAYYQRS